MKLKAIIKSLLTIYLLLVVSVYLLQRYMIYQPTQYIDHKFKTIQVNHSAQTTEALLTKPSKQQVIIYFGGNAENVIYTAKDFDHHFPNHSTYLMKYRGYSGAVGKATEVNLYADALALFDFIQQTKPQSITTIGRSLGSGIATYVAANRSIDGLVLVTPFDSIKAVAQDLLPFLPVKWLLKDSYDSKSRASEIEVPILLVVADKDEVISSQRTHSLTESLPQKQLKIITLEAGHNDFDFNPSYFKSIQQFLNHQNNLKNTSEIQY